MQQLPLFQKTFHPETFTVPFPTTRYQGSKRKFADWIWESTAQLQFDSVLDVFGGTGTVSHKFKSAGKQVTYNDKLAFNWLIGLALIENSSVTLTDADIAGILHTQDNTAYPDFIQNTFQNIFFKDEENVWLDRIIYNLNSTLQHPLKRALAWFALFQACIIKRPYNLFHRANLYMREADVERSFGNKTTWDTSFEEHFRNFVAEANAVIFDNRRQNIALNLDALETPIGADLVYLDPPYFNAKGVGTDYREFYHFLEGMTDYQNWSAKIDYKSKHRRLITDDNAWSHVKNARNAFEALIERHRDSILVLSYRDDGIPSRTELLEMLRRHKPHVREVIKPQKYALSKRDCHELLLIAE